MPHNSKPRFVRAGPVSLQQGGTYIDPLAFVFVVLLLQEAVQALTDLVMGKTVAVAQSLFAARHSSDKALLFLEILACRVPHQVVRIASLPRGLVGELRFEFGREMHFHDSLVKYLSQNKVFSRHCHVGGYTRAASRGIKVQ